MASKRIYQTTCIDCGTAMETLCRPPAEGMSCGMGPCNAAHNARVTAYQAEVSRRRSEAQRSRRARTDQPLYGDYAQLAALHGIRTDGTGRRA